MTMIMHDTNSRMNDYLNECRITEARQALDNAMKEYTQALRSKGVPIKLLASDVCEVLAWATDQEIQLDPNARVT